MTAVGIRDRANTMIAETCAKAVHNPQDDEDIHTRSNRSRPRKSTCRPFRRFEMFKSRSNRTEITWQTRTVRNKKSFRTHRIPHPTQQKTPSRSCRSNKSGIYLPRNIQIDDAYMHANGRKLSGVWHVPRFGETKELFSLLWLGYLLQGGWLYKPPQR